MNLATWIAFCLAAIVIAVSPGSGAVLSMSHGLSYGVKKTTATILGLQAGLLLLLFVAGAGVGSLLVASETAFNLIKVCGAFYLIYLGAMQWRARVESAHASSTAGMAAVSAPAFRLRFLAGFFTNATNPKGVIFMVAVLPQFIDQHAPILPQLGILAATMVSIDLVVMHSYALAASSMQRFLRDAAAMKAQNRLFGGLLMAIGAALFFVRRQPA